MKRIYVLLIGILLSSSATAQFVLQKSQVNTAGGTLIDGTYKTSFSVGNPTTGVLQDANYKTIIGFYPVKFNNNPTALFIQGTNTASIDENKTVDGVTNLVGGLTTTDLDVNDAHTYTLVAGTGDTDNAIFSIVGDMLLSQQVLNFEAKPTYSVRMQTNDGYGGTTAGRAEQVFTINVNNVNDAPTDLAVDGAAIDALDENLAIGTVVGVLTTTDQDIGSASDTHIYSLAAGINDNDLFSISGNELQTASSFDFETKASYLLTVRTTDSGGTLPGGGLTFDKDLTITINDTNDAPTDIVFTSDSSYPENLAIGTTFATLVSTDQDAVDTYTYSLVDGTGDADNSQFEIVGNEIKNTTILNFERVGGPVYSLRVQTSDVGSEIFQKEFPVTVTDMDDAPSGMNNTSFNILEGNSSPTTLGLFIPIDDDLEANDNSNYSWTLLPQQDFADFLIGTDGGTGIKSLVANTVFDYATKSLYNIVIRVSDVKDLSGNARAQGILYTEIPIQVQVLSATDPNISSFSPTNGSVGTSVTITGTNFSATTTNNIVKFNGIAASVTGSSATSITTSVPTSAATGKITVEVGGQTATSSGDFTVTVAAAPTITSFSPTSGETGTDVTITGTNFNENLYLSGNSVKFNGTQAAIKSVTATTIVATVPFDIVTGKIEVNLNGQIATSVDDFIIIPSITAEVFPATYNAGGELVVELGLNNPATASEVRFHKKGISQSDSEWVISAVTHDGNSYKVTLGSSVLIDKIGMEYYFTIDYTGGQLTSNSGASYISYPSTSIDQAIPSLSFGDQVANYQIISIPLTLEKYNVTDVFSSLIPYYNTKWRLYDYANGNNREYSGFTTINVGKGYWLIVRNSTVINPGAGTTVQVNQANPFTIALSSGWNLIGNPYNFRISWEEVLAYNGNPTDIGNLKTFAGGTLSESTTLDRYRGGFVFNGGSAITIDIPVARNSSLGGRIGVDEKPMDIGNSHWELALELSQGDLHNKLGGIGMHPKATIVGKDAFDEVSVPMISGMGFFELGFAHPEYNARFNKEMIPTTNQYTWEMEVIRDNGDLPVTLSWNNEYFGENDHQLYLFNPTTLQVVDMRMQTKYEVGVGTDHLQILFGKQEYVDNQLDAKLPLVGEPYPNPTFSKLTIPFKVPKGNGIANVAFKVYDNTGRLIGQLNRNYEEGIHELNWEFDHAGLYIIQIDINGERSTKKVIVK